jgi:hypothetical protein
MVNLFDLLQQKLEIFRLEQRYTRRRNRRSTFVSEATYVDGEYVYSPTSTSFAKYGAGSSVSEVDRNEKSSADSANGSTSKASKRRSKMCWAQARIGSDKRQSEVAAKEVKVFGHQRGCDGGEKTGCI